MGVCVGVDVAKAHLDWVLGSRGETERCPNTPAGVRRLVRRLCGSEGLDRVVLESTAQYERVLLETIEDQGAPSFV